MRKTLFLLAVLVLSTLGIMPEGAAAQQCPTATTVNFPVDTASFTLAQGYGVPSPRHQGRYHTGEDWHLGRGMSLGQPVSAIAAGRVTYSYPLGWGRDGGVIIIEHTLADGTVFYSQYGHIAESGTVTFPLRSSCVEAGQVIAVIADARPAPHLHFEIRTAMPDTPGPGYAWTLPDAQGWRQPSQFILNYQARAQPAARWQLITNTLLGAPPLELDDHSLMYIDGDSLRLATYDGRVLWRVLLDQPAVAVVGYQRAPLVFYADGSVQQVDYQGAPVARWTLAGPIQSAPVWVGDSLLYQAADGALVMLAANLQEAQWRLPDMPLLAEIHPARDVIGLLSQTSELLIITREGRLLERTQLRAPAGMAVSAAGDLLVLTQTGLWQVAQEWTLLADTPAVNGSSALTLTEDGRIFLFDGAMLRALDPAGTQLWQLPMIATGRTVLQHLDTTLVLLSSHGQVIAASDSGTLCGVLRVYGDNQARVWSSLGDDGVLRVSIGDLLMGLDWAALNRPCTPR